MATRELYIFGIPALLGGASTKVRHLVLLLRDLFQITVVLNDRCWLKDKEVSSFCKSNRVRFCILKELPAKLDGVALVVCELEYFSTGVAQRVKDKGLKCVFSNEMMWEFKGEAEAVKNGLIDRVLFVSDFQQKVFADLYRGVPQFIVGNYIAAEDFPFIERRQPVFTIGRLSRPDPAKYPEDFPVFYEELGLKDVKYRVMAWDDKLRRKYKWHTFGPEWDLLGAQRESSCTFLHTLDLFVYPLGHLFKESWGRSTAEALLTGCIPLVPDGHQFHNMIVHGETGFICGKFADYQAYVHQLYEDYSMRIQMSNQCALHARKRLFNPECHRKIWLEALTF